MGTLEQTEQAGAGASGRDKRSLKNLLINKRFQLKYTLIVVFLALVISAVLGVLLLSKVSENTQLALNSARGMAALREKLAPVAAAEKAAAAAEIERELVESEKALKQRDREVMIYLVVCLLGLVLAITLLGIFVTHKVAGPLFVLTRYMKQIGDGNLRDVRHLRKGDELLEFFETFEHTLRALQERTREEIGTLESALKTLRDQLERAHTSGAGSEAFVEDMSRAIDALVALKKKKQEALG
jgi:nitrogen fixation/metabolism regulation signal transduction histidine kinase